jgi:hypothetical protein
MMLVCVSIICFRQALVGTLHSALKEQWADVVEESVGTVGDAAVDNDGENGLPAK